jgi:hypothetical protein
MAYLETSFLLWLLGVIQIAGLLSAWLARLSEGSRSQASCQWLFFACLGLMGLTTMASVALGPRYWLASGATLSVMILGAIWDFRPAAKAERL